MQNGLYLITTGMTLLLVSYLGIAASKKIKSAEDFTIGGRSFTSRQVATSIIGTLVGGASTIGTAQAAFVSGLNGMWFTLGASLACIFLGLILAKPLRNSNVQTIPEFIQIYYGKQAGRISSIVSSFAIYVHITGQLLAAVAILTSLFYIDEIAAVFLSIAMIISYILFGGQMGSSVVSYVKTILLYLTLTFSAFIILKEVSGLSNFVMSFPKDPWFNLISQGPWVSFAMGFSLIVGVSSTQTYLQAIFSGKTYKESRNGAFIAALLIPPIGLMSTMIGMFMRLNHPDIASLQALPLFIIDYLNPVIGGLVIGTLIISVIATGSGLTLGISTMISRDIYKGWINLKAEDHQVIKVLRVTVIIISMLSASLVIFNLDSLILQWAFLSMTLRGTVIFVPMIFALILRGKTPKKAGLLAMILSPLITIIISFFGKIGIDPLYIGIGLGVMIFVVALTYEKLSGGLHEQR